MQKPITLTQQQLADTLGISKKTLQNRQPALFKAGMPRPLPLGGTPVWRIEDIKGWIDRLASLPNDTHEDQAPQPQPQKRGKGRPRNIERGAA